MILLKGADVEKKWARSVRKNGYKKEEGQQKV
jgi:hypothetical protein